MACIVEMGSKTDKLYRTAVHPSRVGITHVRRGWPVCRESTVYMVHVLCQKHTASNKKKLRSNQGPGNMLRDSKARTPLPDCWDGLMGMIGCDRMAPLGSPHEKATPIKQRWEAPTTHRAHTALENMRRTPGIIKRWENLLMKAETAAARGDKEPWKDQGKKRARDLLSCAVCNIEINVARRQVEEPSDEPCTRENVQAPHPHGPQKRRAPEWVVGV
ncbi:hypothetical protein B0T26DRAFT_70359 [Lasiosphaeria miniovina]|uniref:Uncharacterized protein n=1 Tax=Lasiosphaeria miniovina TaxID=1954250 RepID=A0AA40BHQ5_9PEZI|nr:uncharacterized protein B0T26DRAFT_70359 [Lasiosphaeria miniovina]KAK0734442.1 hypothetical protein B0T26DRAFT_70359 [Lasiosphaeria miniovina]